DLTPTTEFINTLIKNGITILRATRGFQVVAKTYPAGSYVVKTTQAFRPHILDMFAPQDHPDDFAFPGGPPIPPYDNAGWTLAYQMGVQFDRILEAFEGPFQKIAGLAEPPPGAVTDADGPAGFLLSHRVNDAAVVMNRLLAARQDVYWLTEPFQANGSAYPAGAIFIPATPAALPILRRAAHELGLDFAGVATKPAVAALRLRPERIALWDRYGGSIP